MAPEPAETGSVRPSRCRRAAVQTGRRSRNRLPEQRDPIRHPASHSARIPPSRRATIPQPRRILPPIVTP